MGTEKIYEFLNLTGMAQKDFAFMCKLNPATLSIALKKNKFSKVIADKIDRYTKGKISYESLTDEPRSKKALRRKKKTEEIKQI